LRRSKRGEDNESKSKSVHKVLNLGEMRAG